MKELDIYLEVEAPAYDGIYTIGKGDDGKWYVTMMANIFKNGGQDATEHEHPKGFSTMSYARKWAYNHHEKLSLA